MSKYSPTLIKELILWRDISDYNSTIFHAIANNGYGYELIDFFSEFAELKMKDDMLSFITKSVNDRLNSCLHVASRENNFKFLEKLISNEVIIR